MTDINHIKSRNEKVLGALVDELFGPSEYHFHTFGAYVEKGSFPLEIKDGEAELKNEIEVFNKTYHDADTGREIISGFDGPSVRYSVGILYPKDKDRSEENLTEDSFEMENEEEENVNSISNNKQKDIQVISELSDFQEDYDLEISSGNAFRQDSAALSVCFNENTKSIKVTVQGGTYKPFKVKYLHEKSNERKNLTWWIRTPEKYEFELNLGKFKNGKTEVPLKSQNTENLRVKAIAYFKNSLVNKSGQRIWNCILSIQNESFGNVNKNALFQSHIEMEFLDSNGESTIIPHPSTQYSDSLNQDELKISGQEDEKIISQLYSKNLNYAQGFGCSASWEENENGLITKVLGLFLPVSLLPSVTTNIQIENSGGTKIEMPQMAELSSEENWSKGLFNIDQIIFYYESWIEEKRKEIEKTDSTSQKMMLECSEALQRIKVGRSLLDENHEAKLVFQWMNQVMLEQQQRALTEKRYASFDKQKNIEFNKDFKIKENRGSWRAFQICFILSNLSSIVYKDNREEREIVELIWFPTGGGKTEAYLGLAAYSILWRRLKDPEDDGTEVLMRYTLRLLTTQQFQRAATLICALDKFRELNEEKLGTKRITIGIFVGGDSSPNTTSGIQQAWRDLKESWKPNKFIITQCPWCSAEMGRSGQKDRKGSVNKELGYIRDGGQSNPPRFVCPDDSCVFSDQDKGLPVMVDDISIMNKTPTMIIGTIDKFAIFPWKENVQKIFGLNEQGNRDKSPPSLIIQDELHLISQSLGSVAGLWEGMIEYFCTDLETNIKPKIICSTATIKEYKEQILCLYGREKSKIFPPPGINIEDSYFGSYEKNIEVRKKTSKMFVGVYAPNDGSPLTTQKRLFTCLTHVPHLMKDEEKDPWWTNMVFCNSIRELNGAETVIQSDMHQYIRVYCSRFSKGNINYRTPRPERLTGELPSDQVPEMLNKLQIPFGSSSPSPLDICLATNILEVGVDIDRLSLMTVIGQPKTTSTYIQATGRVGRDQKRPGLIVTLYSPSKPRDKSHYENFFSYHQRLYSEVEPTSVTPFTPEVLKRVFHSIIVSYIKMHGQKSPRPFPEDKLEELKDLYIKRIKKINNFRSFPDSDWLKYFEDRYKILFDEMKYRNRAEWISIRGDEDALMVAAGDNSLNASEKVFWKGMLNMRSVDSEASIDITDNYDVMDGPDA